MEYSFEKAINSDKLVKELKAAGLNPSAVNRVGDSVTVVFEGEVDSALLNSVMSAHSAAVIKPVSPRQIKTALVMSGFSLANIDAGIEALAEPQKSIAKIAWEYSVEFNRDNELILSLAPGLGFTDAQLDQLFQLAATL